jgi:hypothetical protein
LGAAGGGSREQGKGKREKNSLILAEKGGFLLKKECFCAKNGCFWGCF